MKPASATDFGGRPGGAPTGVADPTRTTGGPAGPGPDGADHVRRHPGHGVGSG